MRKVLECLKLYSIMYVILVYDIGVKRVSRIQKICKNYLFPVQKSVFEGNITEAKLDSLKMELKQSMDTSMDSIIIYHLDSVKYAKKEQIGIIADDESIF